MPKTNVASASSRVDPYFGYSAGRRHPTSMAGKRGDRTVDAGKWIEKMRNDPCVHPFRACLDAQHASRTSAALLQPEPLPQTRHWFMHRNPVPPNIRDNHDAHESYMRAVLQADAVVHSEYWQRVLGGRALCVLHDDGQIAFRISANKHDSLLMFKSDVVIQLTAEGPKAYNTVTHETLPDAHLLVQFNFAASLAARLEFLTAPDVSFDIYIDAIYHHEEALERSVQTWIKSGNHGHLCRLKELVMGTGSAAT